MQHCVATDGLLLYCLGDKESFPFIYFMSLEFYLNIITMYTNCPAIMFPAQYIDDRNVLVPPLHTMDWVDPLSDLHSFFVFLLSKISAVVHKDKILFYMLGLVTVPRSTSTSHAQCYQL